MNSRRRDDRPHDDRYKVWVPHDKQPDHDHDRRRQRSATVPSQTHDPRSQPPDNKRSSRAYRQEPHYTTIAPSTSNQPPPAPSSSRTFHPPRSAAQNPSAAYHASTPYHAPAPIQPPQVPQTSKGYSAAAPSSSSRRAQPDNLDSRSYQNRRAPTAPTLKSSYEHRSAEDAARTSRQPSSSRTAQPSTQTMQPANWPSSTQDSHVKRSKDRDKERDRNREPEKDRNKERNVTELDRYRERYRPEPHREKDKGLETERQREPSRFRGEKKMESDSEGLMYPDNASKASLSGREYQPSVRESISGHRRQRTEDGPSSSTARRNHTDPSHNHVYMQSTGSQAAAATGNNPPGVGSNPPPAPRVMPVYLPQKPLKSHHERHGFSAAHGGHSSSDAERASLKYRMERNPSGAPVQRGDAYTSSVVKERQGQDGPAGPRDDTRSKSEAKYSSTQGAYYNSRPPLQPASVNTVDIPLVTPGFNSSPLPHESRGYVGTIPVLVAGEGPADRQTHDTLYKPQTAPRKDELQDARYPHVSHASLGKPSLGRSQSSEVPHSQSEVPPLDRSRTDPAAVNILHDRHYRPNEHVPPQSTSRYHQFTNMTVEAQPSQPRSTHKISFSNPQAVSGPRPQPPPLYADNQNESTRPVTAATPAPGPMTRVASTQPSAPPSPAHKTDASPARNGSAYGFLPSAHTGTHGSNATSIKRSPSTPPPTPMTSSQTMMNASQPYTRNALHPNEPPSRSSLDRPEPQVVAPRMATAQMSSGGTIKSSWVVQTAQADMQLKNGYPSREEKYSARNGLHQPVDPSAVAHPQLREVLSQDNHHSPTAQPRAAPTPTQGSPKRPSPHGTPRAVHAVAPRRTPDSSPRMLKVKEPTVPEQPKPPPFPPPPALGPPQIAVIGATPSTVNEELPHRSHYNTGLLAPAYPAPSRVSKTTPDSPLRISRTTSGSGSRDYQTPAQTQIAHTHPVTSTAYQQTPVLPQSVSSHVPQSSSHGYGQYTSNSGGQFSPPPLPVPPPLPHGQSASNTGAQFSPPPLPVPPPRMPGVDIAEDIFPVKVSSSIGPTGSNPAPPSPAVSWQPAQAAAATPTSAASTQPHVPNGHVDSYKNKPGASEGTGTKPTTSPYQKAAAVPASSREAVTTTPVEARTMPSSSAGATGFANGTNQGIPGSQHPPPQSQGVPAGSYPSTNPQLKRKVTIEEVPESPMFTNQRSPSLPQTHTPTQPSETPMHPTSVPSAKAQPSEANTPKATPPSKPQDVSAHTPIRPPITPTQSYPPAPSTQHPTYAPASSRPPYSAPPMQSSFSSSYVDTLHRSTFSAQPREYPPRPTPISTSVSTAAAQPVRSAPQPLTVAQSATLDAASKDAHAKLQSSRPLVGTPAQPIRQFGQPLSTQSALLDAAARGKQVPTGTVTAPQPQSLLTAETNPQSSRPLTSASAAAAQAIGRQQAASAATVGPPHPQNQPNMEAHANPHSSRPIVPPVTIPQGPTARAAATPTVASQVQDAPIPNDSARSRGFLSSFSRNASAAINPLYPATHRQPTPATSNQQSKQPPPPMHSNSHNRTVSLPTPKPISTSNANSRPPSPRKTSQPLVNSSATSTQPFPTASSQANAPSRSAKTADSSWASRVAASGYPSTPRAYLPSAINRALSHESEVLLTPSSIAPSMPKTPQMTFNNSVSHATASPMRQRQMSTDSRESKKKSGGFLGGLFRTKSGSSRPLESPVITPSPVHTFIGGAQKSPAVVAPPMQYSKSSSSAKESKEKITATAPPAPAAKIQVVHTTPNPPTTSSSVQPKAPAPKVKAKAKAPDSAALQPPRPSRDQKPPASSNVFSPFSFLTSKRKRTMSGASLDVCDGNTATNTAVGSPYVNQAEQLPPIPPPPVRDPMRATGEWRDKTEQQQQQKRKKNRPRPGVTFDVEEDPPSPYPGKEKGGRLIRRKSGRTSTPGPARR